ncbi:MAG: M1 family metallopeptidase, partial [Actinomycetota bacterium]|nr:M1 family metallopeptidase [Actinomycetota bacterium]
MTPTSHRLPDGIRPSRYDLELRPDLVAGTFDGSVRITVQVDAPAERIVLHALDLDLTGARVIDGDVALDVEHIASEEQIVLSAPDGFAAGEHVVALTFRGVLNDQLVGFYRSNFTSTDPGSGDQVEHTLAVTQFESTHARRAFPCFDEPALKAVFSISLVVPEHLLAVSNSAEVAREELGDGLVRVRFADTMVMSTYLVAFVIGPLEATATRMVDGAAGPIPLRVVHPPGTGALTEFALDVAEHGLRYFEQYYGLPYPGDKVDLVAVPDFGFGAMENLGCITFREVLLLIDPEASTPSELQRVADVIHHELAHMWFGDLVTMKWWNGIWLNEAFATFMEVMASDSFRPEWDVWTSFGLARAAAFDTDALRSTRPIEYEVVTAADSEGMFDILTYEKGASVVRMLEQYLGAEPFRAGISAYLHRHAYGCTETTDLWDALEEVTGEPVRRIMDNWIFRGGHPAVEVTATATGVELAQSRFRYAADDAVETAGDTTADTTGDPAGDTDAPWPIPVVLA